MQLNHILQDELMREWIEPHYLQEEIVIGLRDLFSDSTPFPYLRIPVFFNYNKLEGIIEELSEQDFYHQSSDLYQMARTGDFEFIETPVLNELRHLFRSESFLAYMSFIAAIPLGSDVDMMGNIYKDTDYLLCHDDKLTRRKIAYIIYLTDLEQGEGGTLNLFDSKNGKPDRIVKKLIPEMNTFTFFLVTPLSFHEVEEVVGTDVYRVSISGWFNHD